MKVNPGQNLFGSTRHIFGKALMAAGNESYIHIGASKLRETNSTSFRETRLRESKHRSNFVWVQKAEGNKAHISLGSQGQGKRIL